MSTSDTAIRLGEALFTKTQRVLLPILFERPDRALHLRELVRRCGTGPGAVQRELARLAGAGVVRRSVQGSQVCFSANRKCQVYSELRAVVRETRGALAGSGRGASAAQTAATGRPKAMLDSDLAALRAFKAALRGRLAVDQLIAFGSRVRGDADADSDLDVLVVVRADPTYEVWQIVSECAWETGLVCGVLIAPVVVSREAWEHGPERSSLLGLAVRREGVSL
jgi:hypothetical protein